MYIQYVYVLYVCTYTLMLVPSRLPGATAKSGLALLARLKVPTVPQTESK